MNSDEELQELNIVDLEKQSFGDSEDGESYFGVAGEDPYLDGESAAGDGNVSTIY